MATKGFGIIQVVSKIYVSSHRYNGNTVRVIQFLNTDCFLSWYKYDTYKGAVWVANNLVKLETQVKIGSVKFRSDSAR